MRIVLGQTQDIDDDFLTYAKQLGITGVQVNTPRLPGNGYWELSAIQALVKKCEKAGVTLEAIEGIPISFYDRVMLGLPGRDDQLEKVAKTIRNIGLAGVRYLGYHFMPLSVWRTARAAVGRGGAYVTVFDAAKIDEAIQNGTLLISRRDLTSDHDSFIAQPVRDVQYKITAAQMWNNFEYFVRSLGPVVKEAGIIMALHPDDPPVPDLMGIARIFSTPESLLRATDMVPNGHWKILLCLGTVSEMGGAAAVYKSITMLGGDRIAYVHMRDVKGFGDRFEECFIGEGNYDPYEALKLLKQVEFEGFIMDDHVPHIVGDTAYNHRSRAYAIGYLQALINRVEAEANLR